MGSDTLAWLSGATIGLGAFLLIRLVLPPAPIDLAEAVARHDQLHDAGEHSGLDGAGMWSKASRYLARYSVGQRGALLGVPLRDLDLLGRSVDEYAARRVLHAAVWSVVVLAFGLVAGLLGFPVPAWSPVVLGIAAAVVGSLVPAATVRRDAGVAREQFRRAMAVYLDLVAQERAAGRSPSQALADAASVGDGWIFTRLHGTLQQAARIGKTPSAALTELAEQISVPELATLAGIVDSATDGAAVYATLTSQAASLRGTTLAADKAEANERSERLVFPVTLLGFGFLILLLYPAMVQLLAA